MPIYAYRCQACGFANDVLQKMSDEVLTVCPSCHQDHFKKQLTAAGFQLKGSGWYVTDFRSNGGGRKGGDASDASDTAAPATDAPATPDGVPAASATPAASAPAAASADASSSSGSGTS